VSAKLHRLAGGLRVVCDPSPELETLAISVVAGHGARSETPERSGWAHLLEHMVFKGAGARNARSLVEAIEAEGGQINAATGYERTSFQVRALKGGLPLAIEILADLVQRPTLDAEELEREKSVVGQEIADAADTPDDRVFELAQARCFAGHALGRPILGEMATVAAADTAALAAFRARQYDPASLVVSACGAVDEDQLLAQVERAFEAAAPQTRSDLAPAEFRSGAAQEARKLEQAHAVMLLPGVGARDPGYFAQRLFAEALGGGMSSRLFQEAREKQGLAYAIDAYAESYTDVGVMGVYAGTAAGDAEQAARVCAQQVLALIESLDDAELSRSKAQLKAHLFMARESPLARAEQSAGQTLIFDRLFSTGEIAAAIAQVSIADVCAFGERMLASKRSATAVLGPKRALAAGQAFHEALFA
jgi:predicted Zn-dependent peptidase